jgi:hypothetical protein
MQQQIVGLYPTRGSAADVRIRLQAEVTVDAAGGARRFGGWYAGGGAAKPRRIGAQVRLSS